MTKYLFRSCECGGIGDNPCANRGAAKPEYGGAFLHAECVQRLERRAAKQAITALRKEWQGRSNV